MFLVPARSRALPDRVALLAYSIWTSVSRTTLRQPTMSACTNRAKSSDEAAAAIAKAKELVAKYKLDAGSFRWPPIPSTTAELGRGRGIGKLAERLIVEHPGWSDARIADEGEHADRGGKG